jgi:acid stress-induced BolA-like protein IbaG/YrbA
MMAKIKIHKHYKGKNQCKGSDRIITAPLDKTLKDNKIHYH